jgi:regulator of replication initiation timing
MAKVATRGLELEPIDRLEEKLKLLVAMVDRLKAEQARAVEDNQRLARELEAMRARMNSTESLSAELTALRGERDAIRTRVVDMLDQLEALNL